jgi:hypothetical protein
MNAPLSLSLPDSSRVLKILGKTIFLLAGLSLLGQYSAHFLGHGRLFGFVPEFNLGTENNIPTYFSGLLLLSASILLGVIARLKWTVQDAFRRYWAGLAFIFAYLSVDEVASLHERLGEPIRHALDTSGVFYYAWVIPGMGLLLLFGFVYARFFWALDARWKRLFAVSGFVYVAGGLGVELVGGWFVTQFENPGFTNVLIVTVEEVLEMSGVALFIYTLMEYLGASVTAVHILLNPTNDRTSSHLRAPSQAVRTFSGLRLSQRRVRKEQIAAVIAG